MQAVVSSTLPASKLPLPVDVASVVHVIETTEATTATDENFFPSAQVVTLSTVVAPAPDPNVFE